MELGSGGAIVSGGSSGLGWATAVELARKGLDVTIADRNDPPADGPAAMHFCRTDVTDAQQVAAAVAEAGARAPLRVAVACAGIGAAIRTTARDGTPHSPRVFEKVLAVNLVGTFHLLAQAAAAMQATEPCGPAGQRGLIVTTASIAAFDGQIGQLAYAASKAGIAGMTLPAARDLGPTGIRVVCIAPGSMETPLLGQLSDDQRDALVRDAAHPRRLGRPDEFAALVRTIIENDYLNGTTIRLDAGLRMPPR